MFVYNAYSYLTMDRWSIFYFLFYISPFSTVSWFEQHQQHNITFDFIVSANLYGHLVLMQLLSDAHTQCAPTTVLNECLELEFSFRHQFFVHRPTIYAKFVRFDLFLLFF